MDSDLIIEEENLESAVKITISGEVDIYTSAKLKDRLYSIADEKKLDIKIDCSGLNYIDSTGLGIFAGTLKRVKKHGNSVYLMGVRSNIRKLFTITDLDKLFIIED